MEKPPSDPLLDAAAAILDGTPVDWNRLTKSGVLSPDLVHAGKAIEALHQVQTGRVQTGGTLPEAPREPAPQGDERFQVIEEIGRGEFGAVLRARDRMLDREVALKVVRPGAKVGQESRSRFVREARTLASLDHPNIVRVYDVDDTGDGIRIVLEYVAGETLDRVVKDRGLLSPEEAAQVGIDLCRALAALHAKGLVHLDLKPSNVIRAKGGRTVLLDFGFTRSTAPGEDAAGFQFGTPLVMAPEQFEGRAAVSPRTDLYALGVVLYFLVTGKYPFYAKSFLELRERVLKERPTPLTDHRPDAPVAFVSLLEHALQREQERRFETAGEFERGLREYLGGVELARRARETHPRWTIVSAFVGLAAVVALGLGIYLVARPSSVSAAISRAQFFKVYEDHRENITPATTVQKGDAITFEWESDRDAWVYVWNEDDGGESWALFPNPSFPSANPLRGGTAHALPGRLSEHTNQWTVSSDGGGRESFFVVASVDGPMAEVEERLAALPRPVPGGEPQLARKASGLREAAMRGVERMRGVGTVSSAKPRYVPTVTSMPAGAASAANQLSQLFATLPVAATSGAWPRAWNLSLRNVTPK